jgi:hypothetical protein
VPAPVFCVCYSQVLRFLATRQHFEATTWNDLHNHVHALDVRACVWFVCMRACVRAGVRLCICAMTMGASMEPAELV